ncbi:LysR family transcriptional regulator [Pseudomonas sp. SP16.1]|uniref:LysR family transcriptional regulator n=1 Tax=Pseudomonas sp. SP16.1 TaxID=3458854 RepID=UPI004046511F
MRLRHIEIFQAILQTGSVTGAARLLNITQPAATKALHHAEAQLGFSLFTRIRGQLHPTAEARLLETATSKVFDDLREVRRLAGNLRGHSDRPLRIVTTPTLAQTLLPASIALWRRRYSKTPCTLATQHTRELIESLLLHEADIGFSLQEPKHPALRSESLAQGSMRVIAGRGQWSEELAGKPMALDELAGQPLIALDTRDGLGSLLSSQLDELEDGPLINTHVQTYQVARSLVEAGLGMAVVDPFTALVHASALQVRELQPSITVTLYALSRSSAGLHPAASALIRQMAEQARQLLQR